MGKILKSKQHLKKNKISKKNINLAKNILQNHYGVDASENICKHLNLMKKKIKYVDQKSNNYDYLNYGYYFLKSKNYHSNFVFNVKQIYEVQKIRDR